jgi:serine/threonine protein kinase
MSSPQDRYEVIETVGTGATCRVERARDTLIGRTVALKTFLQGFGSRDLQEHFVREAQIIGALSHPNIVTLYDVGTNKDGAPYFVMEYVEGKTLEAVLDDGLLTLPRAATWAGDLATALGQAHRAKIIHGDVKPANILVTPEGQIKLGDFGIAHISTQISGSGNLSGTPAYLSPEQIQDNLQDSRSDLFSLGIVLYEMSTGVQPFKGDSVGAVCAQIISISPPSPSHCNPSLPPAFDEIVMRCLAKNPADRYASAEALAAAVYPFARNRQAAAVRLPAHTSAALNVRIPWWNRPLQARDLRIAAGWLFLITAMSTVPALRKRSIPTLTASAATVVPPAASPSRSVLSELVSTSMISITPSGIVPSLPTDLSSTVAEAESPLSQVSPTSIAKTPRHKESSGTRRKASTLASHPAPDASAGPTPATALSPNAQPAHAKQFASLRIEITSGVAEETLAVSAGEDVLVSTKLNSAHLGEPIVFDCPLSPGSHTLRVALYRADESLHLQKEGFAEIASDSLNTLDIRVSRRSKLLIRKEVALDVSWPSPHSAMAKYTSPPEPISTSSK